LTRVYCWFQNHYLGSAMASLIPGFEYDIFISYRHNDNLDGWVTYFVQDLEKELKATLKEQLTIYFDRNPDDGLLETHNVDKSLAGKLKCLIFIPIVSQTYCDPKSFAWRDEFCKFNTLASADTLGRDIELNNGNVASRILPIRIHDLDADDRSLIEKETGSAMRAIEFIFKSPGVNRPLTPVDKKEDNGNSTNYRDQINKTANAIKEIAQALTHPSATTAPAVTIKAMQHLSARTTRVVSIGVALIVTICAAIYLLFQQTKAGEPEHIEKSIAVLPFTDLSKEQDLEYLGDGLAEEIINVLTQTKDLRVIARSSSFQFKGKNEDLREIGDRLGVTTILEGSVRKYGEQIRVSAQLIKVSDGSHYWSRNMDQRTENLFEIQDAIAREVAGALKASLVEGVTSKQKTPWNEEAQKLYQKGRFFYDRSDGGDFEKAYAYFKQSYALDSSQAITLSFLAGTAANLQQLDSEKYYALKAIQIDSAMPEVRASTSMIDLKSRKLRKAFYDLEEALKSGNSNPLVLRTAAYFAVLTGNFKQGVELAKRAVDADPLIAKSYRTLNMALLSARDYPELLKASSKGVELFPGNDPLQAGRCVALIMNRKFDEALENVSRLSNNTDFLILLYFQQKNKAKLDSIYAKFNLAQARDIKKIQYFAIKGETEKMFQVLNKHTIILDDLFEFQRPYYDSIRNDERFREILKPYTFTEKNFRLQSVTSK
jgi:adenylate cyclase